VQTRTRNAIVFGAVAVVATTGFAALAHYRQAHDLAAHALDAVPSGALLVATADLTALRASPVGAAFLREGREIPGLGKVRDVCGFDPMDTLTEVAVAIPAAGDAGEFGLVAAGPVDDEALVGCASRVIDARGGHAVTTAVGSFRSVRDATLSITGGEIAVRRGGPLLLGAGAYLRAMIDAADGRSPTIRSSTAHAFLAREVGEASARVTVVLTPEQRRTLAEELESGGAAGSPAAAVRAGALGVKLGQVVSLDAVVSCENATACAELARALGEARDARARELAVRLVGFGALLEQVKITADGGIVHARVELPADQAARLAERLVALRGMRHPMPGPDSPAPQPDEILRLDAGARRAPAAGSATAPTHEDAGRR
jgi:hypothetical protein